MKPRPSPLPALRDLQVTERAIAELRPHPKNARTHSDRQLHQLAKSIETFGFTVPVLIDDQGLILAGHGRVAAARRMGLQTVPTILIADLSDRQKRAYVIADNRIGQLSGWDADLLAQELAALAEHADGLEFDLEATGFDWGEIDVLIAGGDTVDKGRAKILGKAAAAEKRPGPEDRIVEPDDRRPPVSAPGTLWRLGEHRLLVGDATVQASYESVLRRDDGSLEPVDLVFTDPPYNVPIDGHVSGLGAVRHREFAMASGEMSAAEFTAFLKTVFGLMAGVSRDGAIHFVCMDWRHMGEVLEAAKGIYAELKNLCVWNKDNAGMGSLYRSKHELVFVFKNGTRPHINHVELGAKGRYRTNVWDYSGVNSFGTGRADLEMHPTVKPVALIADAIRDCSNRQGIVLDPFGGSGSTLIAAERTGRKARLIEIDAHYADTIIRRWQELSGGEAVDAASGQMFKRHEAAGSTGG
jgi:DNA modification methylase/ParB-like chromosome segregation protein Spo0J